MKEYRIVCDRRTVHFDGTEHTYEHVAVWVTRCALPVHHVYLTKAEAMKALSETIRRARKFDAESQDRFATGDKDVIAYHQTNIRLQSRNVTEWKD